MTLDELRIIELCLKEPEKYKGTITCYQALEFVNKEIALKTTDFVTKELADRPQNVKCPDCGGDMIPRTSLHGKFWGCKQYPRCKGTRDSMGRSKADREKEKNEQVRKDLEDIGPDPNSQYRWRR